MIFRKNSMIFRKNSTVQIRNSMILRKNFVVQRRNSHGSEDKLPWFKRKLCCLSVKLHGIMFCE